MNDISAISYSGMLSQRHTLCNALKLHPDGCRMNPVKRHKKYTL